MRLTERRRAEKIHATNGGRVGLSRAGVPAISNNRCVTNDASVTAAIAAAGYKIFQQAYSQQPSASSKGVFLSPLSIVYALALAINGAGIAPRCLPTLALEYATCVHVNMCACVHVSPILAVPAAFAGYQSPTHTELLNAALSYPAGQSTSSSAPSAANTSAPVPCESDLNAVLGQTVAQLTSGSGNSSGAAGGGSTDSSDGSGAARFILANSVWSRGGITLRPEYVEAMQKIYNVSQ